MSQLTYDHALSRIPGKWRGLLAIVSFVVGFLIISSVVGGAGFLYEYAVGGVDLDALSSGVIPLTPAIMLTNNLSLAASIPLVIVGASVVACGFISLSTSETVPGTFSGVAMMLDPSRLYGTADVPAGSDLTITICGSGGPSAPLPSGDYDVALPATC